MNVSRVNTVLNTHTALLTNHGQRIDSLEGVSSDVIVSTQLLASTANETTGKTNRIQAEVRPGMACLHENDEMLW